MRNLAIGMGLCFSTVALANTATSGAIGMGNELDNRVRSGATTERNVSNVGNTTEKVSRIKDVETLRDDPSKYSNQRVQVQAEVESKLDARSVVLESGGLTEDDIVVVAGPNMTGDLNQFEENSDVLITGTVVVKPANEIQRTYNWTPDSKTQKRLENARAFLIADEVTLAMN